MQRLLFDDAACGLLETDDTGLISRVNALFCEWIGLKAVDLIGTRKIQDFFTVGGRIFHQTHWVPLLQMQQSISEVKFELVHADGHRFPVILNAIRRTRNGTIVHDLAAFVARDRDVYESELLRASKRLAEVATFAELMVGIVSHDLRNPLASIEMSALALQTEAVTPAQQTAIARIERATRRSNRLINSLLDLTQTRLGKGLALAVKSISLHAVVADAVDELRPIFQNHTIVHTAHGKGDCEGDPDRLVQLIGNLAANAVAYGAPRSTITVTSSIAQEHYSILVHNEGTPIAAEMLPKLFQPMTRGFVGTSQDRSIGLGLFIVQEIASAHGGKVTVASDEDSGTTFTATFRSTRSTRV